MEEHLYMSHIFAKCIFNPLWGKWQMESSKQFNKSRKLKNSQTLSTNINVILFLSVFQNSFWSCWTTQKSRSTTCSCARTANSTRTTRRCSRTCSPSSSAITPAGTSIWRRCWTTSGPDFWRECSSCSTLSTPSPTTIWSASANTPTS